MGNSYLCKGVNIHGPYRYIWIIVDPTTLTTLGQLSHNFGPLYYINSDTAYLQTVIADIRMI